MDKVLQDIENFYNFIMMKFDHLFEILIFFARKFIRFRPNTTVNKLL